MFARWMKEKKLSSDNLKVFKSLSRKQILPVLDWISSHRPSHSEGVEILELAGELLLMDRLKTDTFQAASSVKALLERLRLLRYPLSLGGDEKKKAYLKGLPWSSGMKGQWIRERDRSGLSIHLTAFHQSSLREKIKNLETLYLRIKEEKVLWEDRDL